MACLVPTMQFVLVRTVLTVYVRLCVKLRRTILPMMKTTQTQSGKTPLAVPLEKGVVPHARPELPRVQSLVLR